MSNIAHSTCPHDCPSTCSLVIEKKDDKTIGRVNGDPTNTYTAGVICAKVARYAERTHHPDRLTVPLKRTGPKGSGEFEEITWEEALDITANAFKSATEKYGPETVWPYFYGGTMGFIQGGAIERLRKMMGYSIMRGTTCGGNVDAGWMAGTGRKIGPDPREMADADLIVIWGTNAVSTQVNVMTHVTKAKKNRNAKVVVVDPYRTPTAETADMHINLQPGTDGALACAIMHVAFRDGYADHGYMTKYADTPKELEEHLKSKSPEWASKITGLSVDVIEEFAKLYCQTELAFIRLGYGLSRCRNGAVNVHAVSSIPVVTGKWGKAGQGIFYSNSGMFQFDTSFLEAAEVEEKASRWLDHSRVGAVLTGEEDDLKGGPPVTAMIIQSTNPMVIAPEQNKVRKGFEREDLFLCVHEQFMTETAKMADIVLPATTFVEHNDFYKGGGHTHFGLAPKIIEPIGEAKSNNDVINELAKRLGAKHPAFEKSENDLIDITFKASDRPDLKTMQEKHWHDCAEERDNHHFINGYGWPDKKFRFKPDWKSMGDRGHELPEFPDHWEARDKTSEQYPFRMMTPPARNFLNSSFNNTKTSLKREKTPQLLINPDDATDLSIEDGADIIVYNDLGAVELTAKHYDGTNKGVVIAEGIWGLEAHKDGKGINQLISAEATAPAGGVAYHDAAVMVRIAD